MASRQAMSSLLCGPGVFLLFLALGCTAAPGTQLCTTESVDEATICSLVQSISKEEVRIVFSGNHYPCQLTFAQYACIPVMAPGLERRFSDPPISLPYGQWPTQCPGPCILHPALLQN
ncbi:uncharacterized protein ACOB8E_000625 [Sarcophilus harrisii]